MSYKSQMTANKALYHVCYKLSQMGWNVMPTARNAAGVDILCINEKGKMISIQRKESVDGHRYCWSRFSFK